MTEPVDIRVTINGTAKPLYVEAATMILAVCDHQENIHKQGAGVVMLEYLRDDVTLGLMRRNYRAKARKLVSTV